MTASSFPPLPPLSEATPLSEAPPSPPFVGWAIVELRGHRRLGGRVSEATVAGVAFIRIDVPHPNDSTLVRATHFYSPTAVQAITPTSEETACAIARGWGARGGSHERGH